MSQRFTIVGPLGSGGQGRVVAVRDAARAGSVVALKETMRDQAEALSNEFALLARLRHPNLVQVFDFFWQTPLPAVDGVSRAAYTQELVDGTDLWRALRRASLAFREEVFEQVMRALAYLHALDVVHLDLKPDNIMVGDTDSGPLARVLDFGIARVRGSQLEAVRGSYSYLAPELLAERCFDARADLYALGVTMAEIGTGRAPSPDALRGALSSAAARRAALRTAGLPDSWVELVTALLAQDPDERPSSVAEAAQLWARERQRPVSLFTSASINAIVRTGRPAGRAEPLTRCAESVARGGATVISGAPGMGRFTVARAAAHAAQVAGHAVEVWPFGAATATPHSFGAAISRLMRDPALETALDHTPEPPDEDDAPFGRSGEAARYAHWVEERADQLASRLLDDARPREGKAPCLVVRSLELAPGLVRAVLGRLISAAEQGRALPIAILATAVAHDGPANVPLGPLDRASVSHFVADRFGATLHDERLCAALVAASGGVPRHLEALVALLVAKGALRFDDRGWTWDRIDASAIPVAADADAALQQLVLLMSPAARGVLGALCWLHFPSSEPTIAAALGCESAPVTTLIELESQGLVWRQARRHWGLAHQVIATHVASWTPPGGAAARARVLATLEPGTAEWAWHTRGSVGAAALVALARQDWVALRAERAAEYLDLALLLDPGSRDALTLRAEVADLLGPRELQVRCLNRLLEGLPESEGVLALEVRSRLFWALTRIGDAARAEAVGKKVVTLARRLERPRVLAESLVHLATVVVQRGDYDESERLLREALESAGHAAPPGLVARAYNNLGNVHAYRDEHEQALQHYRAAWDAKVAEGDPVGERIAVGNMGLMCLRLDRPRQALAHFATSYRAAASTGHQRGLAWSLLAMAVCGLEAGALSYAERRASAALATAASLGDRLIVCDAETTLAEIKLAAGDHEGARVWADKGASHAQAVSSANSAARARLVLGWTVFAVAPERATKVAALLVDDERADEVTRAGAARLVAEAALKRGDLDGASAAAASALASTGRALTAAVLETGARVLELAGDARAAGRAWADAKALISARAASWPDEPAEDGVDSLARIDGPSRRTFESQPHVRSLLGRPLPAASPTGGSMSPAASQTPSASGRDMPARLATESPAQIVARMAHVLADIVVNTGAERGFVVLDDERVLCSRDADGESVNDPARKVPEAALREARIADGAWRAAGSAGGAVYAVRLRAVVGTASVSAVLLLQNRFVATAFEDVQETPAGAGALSGLLRVWALERRVAELSEALGAAEAERRAAETRSTEEILALRRELESTREQLGPRHDYPGIVFGSAAMKRMLLQVDRVVATDLPVHIHGESGTGKELVARAIHFEGSRGSGPFIAQNCSAIPRTLFESEFFGHEKGAFTGANRASPGLFRRASGGTLFLDEIGDLPLDLQAKLLRVLETNEVRPVGGSRTYHVDVRIISATHHDLNSLVAESRFREDLFYRLNVIRIDVPALRQRPDDIPVLCEHFLSQRIQQGEPAVGLGEGVMKALIAYNWPGNVRQLENEMTRAALLCDGVIHKRDLSPQVASARGGGGGAHGDVIRAAGLDRGSLKERVARLERLVLRDAMQRAGGNKSQVARELGLSRAGLNMKLKRLDLWDADARS